MNRGKLKQKIIKDDLIEYKCEICSLTSWREKTISLHLDHIDGNRNNNEMLNLRFLCPNCHSQTPTYCGKNNRVGYGVDNKKVDDEILIELLEHAETYKEVLDAVGLAGGGNYSRLKRLAKENNIIVETKRKREVGERIKRLKESNIDFSKFGWVEKVSKSLGITPQNVRKFLMKECPDFLIGAYARKSDR